MEHQPLRLMAIDVFEHWWADKHTEACDEIFADEMFGNLVERFNTDYADEGIGDALNEFARVEVSDGMLEDLGDPEGPLSPAGELMDLYDEVHDGETTAD